MAGICSSFNTLRSAGVFFIDTAEEDDDIAVICGTEGAVFVHDLPLFFHKGADLFGNEPAFKGDARDIIDGLIHGNSIFIGYFINKFHFDCTACVGSGTGVFDGAPDKALLDRRNRAPAAFHS